MKVFNSAIVVFCFLFLFTISDCASSQVRVEWSRVHVLVYTKNGKGYVHDNIPSAVSCIQKLGRQHGFKVDTSANPSVMTVENLKKYRLLIFPSTNNDVFDTGEQRLAFRRYIEAGGGFVGNSLSYRNRTKLEMVQDDVGWHFFMFIQSFKSLGYR